MWINQRKNKMKKGLTIKVGLLPGPLRISIPQTYAG